tara:strand:- start:129 stop:371 length:243 start_codon:yes stop_codon:yes gene_type:complete
MSDLFKIDKSLSPAQKYIEDAISRGIEVFIASEESIDGEFIAEFNGKEFEGETEIEAVSGLLEELGHDSFDQWRMKGGAK